MELGQAIRFAIMILPILYDCRGWVDSWLRSEQRNSDVGGHEKSRHLDATAVDAWFYSAFWRNLAYDNCYDIGLHGYKKGPVKDTETGLEKWGFHMQLEAPRGS